MLLPLCYVCGQRRESVLTIEHSQYLLKFRSTVIAHEGGQGYINKPVYLSCEGLLK